MATIAVLGMGLLGSAFAENLLAKGHQVLLPDRMLDFIRARIFGL